MSTPSPSWSLPDSDDDYAPSSDKDSTKAQHEPGNSSPSPSKPTTASGTSPSPRLDPNDDFSKSVAFALNIPTNSPVLDRFLRDDPTQQVSAVGVSTAGPPLLPLARATSLGGLPALDSPTHTRHAAPHTALPSQPQPRYTTAAAPATDARTYAPPGGRLTSADSPEPQKAGAATAAATTSDSASAAAAHQRRGNKRQRNDLSAAAQSQVQQGVLIDEWGTAQTPVTQTAFHLQPAQAKAQQITCAAQALLGPSNHLEVISKQTAARRQRALSQLRAQSRRARYLSRQNARLTARLSTAQAARSRSDALLAQTEDKLQKESEQARKEHQQAAILAQYVSLLLERYGLQVDPRISALLGGTQR